MALAVAGDSARRRDHRRACGARCVSADDLLGQPYR